MVPPENNSPSGQKRHENGATLFATVCALFESSIVRKEEETGPESGRSGTTMVPPSNNSPNGLKHHENGATLFAAVCALFESFIVRKRAGNRTRKRTKRDDDG